MTDVWIVTAECWETNCEGHIIAICSTPERADELADEAKAAGDPPGRWYEIGPPVVQELDRLIE